MTKKSKRLPPGIAQRGGKFRVSVMVDGERRTATTDTLDAAILKRDELKVTIREAAKVSSNWSITQGFESYVEQSLRPSGAAESSCSIYLSRGRSYVRFFGDTKTLDGITSADLVLYVAHMKNDRGSEQSTIKKDIGTLLTVMRHARKMGGMSSPLPEMPMIRLKKSRARYITDDEEETLLGYFRETGEDLVHDAIVVMVDTGMRVDVELLARPWTDIDLKARKIFIWESKSVEPRVVPMTSRVFATLSRLKLHRGQLRGPFSGLTYETLRDSWQEARQALNREADRAFTMHILRHTFCTRLVAAGVDLKTVQRLAGHKDIQTTMQYAHFIPEQGAEAINLLERRAQRVQAERAAQE